MGPFRFSLPSVRSEASLLLLRRDRGGQKMCARRRPLIGPQARGTFRTNGPGSGLRDPGSPGLFFFSRSPRKPEPVEAQICGALLPPGGRQREVQLQSKPCQSLCSESYSNSIPMQRTPSSSMGVPWCRSGGGKKNSTAPLCLLQVGFLKTQHRYEIVFTLPEVSGLGRDVCPAPVPSPHLRITDITPAPEGGLRVKCEYMALQEGVLCEEALLLSETNDAVSVRVKVQARVMGELG
ncbi:unnamed protein product [Menidia menidia]|uniref:(Atlantic silverside) hypothetical protein n=1 Tax=Menidia menidia TaxID=238744 RepID=A0A8S4BQA7_9TELE|nr:unnamed protein product [Menidia menidia]